MSAATYHSAAQPADAEALDPAAVKGRSALVAAYRLPALAPSAALISPVGEALA